MDLEGLSTFVLLAEHGSGAQVAKLQGLSQAAVSQRIARVEAAYGVRLFIRCGDGMTLTDEAQHLLPDARAILQQVVELGISVTRELRNDRGFTRILIDRSMRGDRMARRLAGIPNFEVARVEPHTQWENSLAAGEVDLALHATCTEKTSLPGLCRFELRTEAGVTFAWNPECEWIDPKAGIAEIFKETLVIPSERLVPGFRRLMNLICDRSPSSENLVTVEVESEIDAREACINGVGVLFFPGNAIQRLRLDLESVVTRMAMEFVLPRAYALNLYVRESEDRPQILKVVGEFVNRGKDKPSQGGDTPPVG
ncbi:LysR family transcriptional regulator [Haloferula sargassicola]|uniref:HTH-type transcriptional activator AllS n=1 Tax=Haloferula sargassicola TaxID=490096 RepID=A0ABP9UN62_9BACT